MAQRPELTPRTACGYEPGAQDARQEVHVGGLLYLPVGQTVSPPSQRSTSLCRALAGPSDGKPSTVGPLASAWSRQCREV